MEWCAKTILFNDNSRDLIACYLLKQQLLFKSFLNALHTFRVCLTDIVICHFEILIFHISSAELQFLWLYLSTSIVSGYQFQMIYCCVMCCTFNQRLSLSHLLYLGANECTGN